MTDAPANWFVDASTGDLHLVVGAAGAIDRAAALSDVSDDYDGYVRPSGSAPDVGADEYTASAPSAVSDLRLTEAIQEDGLLTVTLRWTAPADGFTTTLRYSSTLVTSDNWSSTAPLASDLSGSIEALSASIPYGGGQVFFALRTRNAQRAWSAVSNNDFWPSIDIYLPTVLRPS